MSNLFIIASRKAYRFKTEVGQLSVEQLWELPIKSNHGVSASSIAEKLYSQIKPTTELSWLGTTTDDAEQEDLKNKLEIVRFIVETRRAEALAQQEQESRKQLLAKLIAEQARRKEESLTGQSDEELAKLIAELEAK